MTYARTPFEKSHGSPLAFLRPQLADMTHQQHSLLSEPYYLRQYHYLAHLPASMD